MRLAAMRALLINMLIYVSSLTDQGYGMAINISLLRGVVPPTTAELREASRSFYYVWFQVARPQEMGKLSVSTMLVTSLMHVKD
jgi:hypothetical protein